MARERRRAESRFTSIPPVAIAIKGRANTAEGFLKRSMASQPSQSATITRSIPFKNAASTSKRYKPKLRAWVAGNAARVTAIRLTVSENISVKRWAVSPKRARLPVKKAPMIWNTKAKKIKPMAKRRAFFLRRFCSASPAGSWGERMLVMGQDLSGKASKVQFSGLPNWKPGPVENSQWRRRKKTKRRTRQGGGESLQN